MRQSAANYSSNIGRKTQTTLSDFAVKEVSIGSKYLNWYLRLKSQRTILENLLQKTTAPTAGLGADEKQALDFTGFLIESLLSVNFVSLFEAVDGLFNSVRRLADGKGISPSTERLLSTFMAAAVAMTKISGELGVTFLRQKHNTGDEEEEEVSDEFSVEMEEPVLVCRICDSKVPVSLFKEHTESCLKSYQSESSINGINEKLRELEKTVANRFLNTPWPGTRDAAVSRLFPSLHLGVLLRRALQLDPHISDTTDELIFIRTVLQGFRFVLLAQYVNTAKALIQEKIKCSNALNSALTVRKQTSVDGQERRAPTTIADFRFIKKISRGAFASVFLAQKKTTGDIFAIKVTPKSSLKQKNQVRRILAEKDILLQFSNPYIVKFFYSIIGEQNLYLVTEFVPGGDLYSLLEHVGALSEDNAKIYAMEILLALRYLRENGIIHRDIKPDNILVSASGHLKLTDFGLSYMGMVDRRLGIDMDQGEGLSQDGEVLKEASSFVGTPDYIAPEIIMNQSHSFTVDYWSLGIMIYEFVYGLPPFHGATERETHRNILIGHAKFDGTNTPEFEDLIKKLLTIDPSRRLGARSIDEIIQHPWFNGVDPDTATPPFIPELASETDTGYFEQRYNFDNNEDASILYDLERCVVPSDFSAELFSDDEISSFPSVALDRLGDTNRELAQRFQRRRSSGSMRGEGELRTSMSFSRSLKLNTVTKKDKPHHKSFLRTNSSSGFTRSKSKPEIENDDE